MIKKPVEIGNKIILEIKNTVIHTYYNCNTTVIQSQKSGCNQ